MIQRRPRGGRGADDGDGDAGGLQAADGCDGAGGERLVGLDQGAVHVRDDEADGHGSCTQCRPSRLSSVSAAGGPCEPAG